MKKMLTIFTLSLVMLFTAACGPKKAEQAPSAAPSAQATPSATPKVSTEKDEESIFGKVNSAKIVDSYTLDGKEVSKEGYKLVLINISIENMMAIEKDEIVQAVIEASILVVENTEYRCTGINRYDIATMFDNAGKGTTNLDGSLVFHIPNADVGKEVFYKLLGKEFGQAEHVIAEFLSPEIEAQDASAGVSGKNVVDIVFENKTYPVRIGEVGHNDDGMTTVEFLSPEFGSTIAFRNGKARAPIMSEITVDGETIDATMYTIKANCIVFTYATKKLPETICVYGNDDTGPAIMVFDAKSKELIE